VVLWAGLGATAAALPIAFVIAYLGKVSLLSGSGKRQMENP
jgi:hypothetical protein